MVDQGLRDFRRPAPTLFIWTVRDAYKEMIKISLFKILKGKAANLPSALHDGWAYFTTDDGKFYIDSQTDGTLKRTLINKDAVLATQQEDGLLSAADKKKLDSYETGSAGGAVEVTLAVASWSSSTTEINGNKYYTYSVSVANIGNPHPQIFCSGGDSIIPSAAQESEFNHIRYALVDTAKSTVTFYSIEKPSVAINVVIKDYLESSIVSGTSSVTIATSDWSSTTSTVNGRAFYTAKKTLSSVSSNYPTIICGTADTLPSDAEQTAFDCINCAAADTSTKAVTFYAIQKPTSAVVAIVI